VITRRPPGQLERAVVDYAAARLRDRLVGIDERSFEGWVVRRFGRTLYEEFFGAYTEKAWRMPCSEISSDWAAQRISQSSLLDAVRTTLFPPRDAARGLVREFWYPASGGIGELAASYARQIEAGGGELRLGAALERIELGAAAAGRAGQIHRVAIGGPAPTVLEADHIVSTLPLTTTVRCLRAADGRSPLTDTERAAATGLEHVAIVFAYVEVPRPSAMPDHWMYLPGRELTVHRLSEFKNFSPDAAPAGSTAVCCEITCRVGDERWRLDDAGAGALALADLERIGLLAPGEGRLLEVARLPRAYPVYDHAYRGRLELLRAALRRVGGLTSTGRQGLFRYFILRLVSQARP
jgi:protoporphyrinogen oxidase